MSQNGQTGSTSWEMKNCVITITHTITFQKGPNLSDADFNTAVRRCKEGIKNTWENHEFSFECCKVKFKFEYVNSTGPNIDTKNLLDGDGRDEQSQLGPGGTGTWYPTSQDPQWEPGVAAHEVGHELGIADQYRDEEVDGQIVSVPIPPYPADGIMADVNGEVQQSDINDIMASLNIECPKKCCNRCLISRSASGTSMENDMNELRLFRDNFVLKSGFRPVFNSLLSAYYLLSPKIVKLMDNHKSIYNTVKLGFAFPFIAISSGLMKITVMFSPYSNPRRF